MKLQNVLILDHIYGKLRLAQFVVLLHLVFKGRLIVFWYFLVLKIPRNSPAIPGEQIFIPRFPGEEKSSPKWKP